MLSASAAALAGSGCAVGFIDSPATNVTDTSATLNGSVASSRSEQGTFWFEYGTTRAYGDATPERTITFTSGVKSAVSEPITGLTPWTDYHYRLCAKDNDPNVGAVCSKDATFTTSDPQITLGPDRPRYLLHVDAADGDSTDPQSGVDAVTIGVDGKQVDAQQPGCSTQNCSLSHDWALNAEEYAPGHHTVTVKATDAVGRITTRELDIEIQRDMTKPNLKASGPLKTAPEGWVDQRDYTVTGDASDSGYGVTSLKLLIDDQQVGEAATQPCPDGGCTLSHTFTVNTASYGGGAHTAQLIATDGAGNSTTSSWTVNVNPDGQIPTAEAIDTLEAAGVTSDTPTVGAAASNDDYPGTAPGIGLEQAGATLQSTGTAAPSTLTTDPSDGVTVGVPGSAALSEEGTGGTTPQPIEITPTQVASDAANATVTTNGVAAVSANTASQVDTLTRPLFDGAMTFQLIRDDNSPQTYSWRVDMDPDSTLRQIDARTAGVYYPDGTQALTIVAEPAHDATGATVPTSLSVDGPNGFTLTVSHQGSGFVYPILAGPGWEAPYTYAPPWGWATDSEYQEEVFGAPAPDTNDPLYVLNRCNTNHPSGGCPQKRRYNFVRCGRATPLDQPPTYYRDASPCSSDSIGAGGPVTWRLNLHGHFHYLFGKWVKIWPATEMHCSTSPANSLARVGPCFIDNFKVGSNGALYQDGGRKLWLFGGFLRDDNPFFPRCYKLIGFLPSRPSDTGPFPGGEDGQRGWSKLVQWAPGFTDPSGSISSRCGGFSASFGEH